MHIKLQVTVQDFIETFFAGDFNDIILLGEGIDEPDLSRPVSQLANGVACVVLPPRNGERGRVPVAVWLGGGHVQESPRWTHERLCACLRINVRFWLLSNKAYTRVSHCILSQR